MQRSGLRWIFRLCSEPGRLWRRYLIREYQIYLVSSFRCHKDGVIGNYGSQQQKFLIKLAYIAIDVCGIYVAIYASCLMRHKLIDFLFRFRSY